MRSSLAVAMFIAYMLGSLLAASAVGDLHNGALHRLAATVSAGYETADAANR
jgi:hypothetical protein